MVVELVPFFFGSLWILIDISNWNEVQLMKLTWTWYNRLKLFRVRVKNLIACRVQFFLCKKLRFLWFRRSNLIIFFVFVVKPEAVISCHWWTRKLAIRCDICSVIHDTRYVLMTDRLLSTFTYAVTSVGLAPFTQLLKKTFVYDSIRSRFLHFQTPSFQKQILYKWILPVVMWFIPNTVSVSFRVSKKRLNIAKIWNFVWEKINFFEWNWKQLLWNLTEVDGLPYLAKNFIQRKNLGLLN